MNRKLTWMEAFAASQVAAWSAVGCLSSAFRMEVTALWEIGGIFAAVSLACILLLSLRRGGWFLLAADEGISNASLKKIEIEETLKEFVHMDIEIE